MPKWIVAAVVALATAGPAHAVVQGRPDTGLARHALMVLNDRGAFCSASLIAPTVLLTAAHCVTGANAYRVHYKDGGGQPVMLEPAKIAVHPGYDAGAVKGRRRSIDMALVRLTAPLPGFEPIGLSQAGRPGPNARLTVAGYGLGVEGSAVSGGQFRTAELGVIEPFGPSSILVWLTDPATGRNASGAGACQGDSGGPILDGGGVIAVTVWAEGAGKARCGALTQGLLVGPQRGWIDGVLGGWGVR
ncbi:trypsin-like serine protease [uncultured Alsobacter sp.]|uniref:S1 family peptidase n=1 Tax=uncultured Alsobacter sp. TaxID=1748258 RepID=UPI0025E2AA67|nr:trypsin-like serine protease [uncultured Alsobacter sp.]